MQNPRNTVEIDRAILGKLQCGLADASYRERVGINASGLKDILISPGHYRHFSLHPKESTPAMVLGTLTHLAVLEPKKYAQLAAQDAGPRHLLMEGGGKCTREAYETAGVIAHSVRKNPLAAKLLSRGTAEACLWWQDPVEQTICKARVDFISTAFAGGAVCVDLKTASDISAEAFGKDCVNRRYDLQAAHYCAGGEESGAFRGDKFVFITVENKPPYFCSVQIADAEFLAFGHQWRAHALEVYNACRKSQQWSVPESHKVALPFWAKTPQQLLEAGQLQKPSEVPVEAT